MPQPRAPGLPGATALALLLLLVLVHPGALSPAAAAPAGWAWPVSPRPAVERHFEAPAKKWLPGHRGVDLHAPPGTEVHAPQAGTVSFTGVVVDREVLTIDHGDGHKSSFEPVLATVGGGDRVTRGQVIGKVAEPGHGPGGTAVHWGVREDREYVNPLQFVVDLRPSVLLPVPQRQ
ncbi:MAG: M23 family metallopeptidase [Kocuria sp.]|uniref:M23 family metallopeptidase n=1 Tax=Kocuria salsicia TaxID=664639 RepID=A0ABV3KBB4_9MICC|nr:MULTISPECIES: M23 family metallopeptidase [Kocuria]MDO4256993.1 M23 family metallopeptidase [Kocuria sp.]